jgi:hypothetical protein
MNNISINQIIDGVELNCITPPLCRNLKNDIQAFIDDYCLFKSNTVDVNTLNKGCLTFTSTASMYQAILDYLCLLPTSAGNITVDVSGLNVCDPDAWRTSTDSNCLFMLDECGNPILTYTVKEIIQIIIRRIISLEIIVKSQQEQIENLQNQLNNLTSIVNNILANCCNVTLVSQISALNSRMTTAENNITTIQTTCC